MKISMRIPALCLLLLVISVSCKKYIEKQQQNAILDIVTDGDWIVTNYTDHDTANITASFAQYTFHFNRDGTVYGVWYGQQTNGTWSADVGSKSITSNFPAATYPINMLNHTWTITDSYADSVAAKTPVDGTFNVLNIRKN